MWRNSQDKTIVFVGFNLALFQQEIHNFFPGMMFGKYGLTVLTSSKVISREPFVFMPLCMPNILQHLLLT